MFALISHRHSIQEPDWTWGQKGCYYVEMFIRTCYDAKYAPEDAAAGLVKSCLYNEPSAEEAEFLKNEICKCPPYVRIEIMRDHTDPDWRDFIPNIKLPTLVLCVRHSNVFDWHGSAWVGENIEDTKIEFFENSGHMLF